MTTERTKEVLENLLDWVAMHDDEFVSCAVKASSLDLYEAEELDLLEYLDGQDITLIVYDNQNNEVGVYYEVLNPEITLKQYEDMALDYFWESSEMCYEITDMTDEELLGNWDTVDLNEIKKVELENYAARVYLGD